MGHWLGHREKEISSHRGIACLDRSAESNILDKRIRIDLEAYRSDMMRSKLGDRNYQQARRRARAHVIQ